jgi:hypothetical protein
MAFSAKFFETIRFRRAFAEIVFAEIPLFVVFFVKTGGGLQIFM